MPYGIVFISTVLPILIGVLGGVAMTWLIIRGILQYKGAPDAGQLEHIAESLELLQQSVDDLRDDLRGQVNDVRELSGRIEFAERLLLQARDRDAGTD